MIMKGILGFLKADIVPLVFVIDRSLWFYYLSLGPFHIDICYAYDILLTIMFFTYRELDVKYSNSQILGTSTLYSQSKLCYSWRGSSQDLKRAASNMITVLTSSHEKLFVFPSVFIYFPFSQYQVQVSHCRFLLKNLKLLASTHF